eukprot:scaffold13502_cov109-Isochrysis_galbana.AAC.5
MALGSICELYGAVHMYHEFTETAEWTSPPRRGPQGDTVGMFSREYRMCVSGAPSLEPRARAPQPQPAASALALAPPVSSVRSGI